jgi:hypothetical protein
MTRGTADPNQSFLKTNWDNRVNLGGFRSAQIMREDFRLLADKILASPFRFGELACGPET